MIFIIPFLCVLAWIFFILCEILRCPVCGKHHTNGCDKYEDSDIRSHNR